MLGKFFVERTGTDAFNYGITEEEKGISFVAEEQEDGTILSIVEADVVRSRVDASGTNLLAGTQSIGGLCFVAPVGQIKAIETI